MLKKLLFILIGFLLAIFLFGKYTAWQIEKWQKTLPEGFPKIEEEEIPKLPQFFSPETFPFPPGTFPFPESFTSPGSTPPGLPPQPVEIEEKEFVSPDGKLKIKYPGDWIELETKNLQKAILEELVKKYQMKLIFLAQKFSQGKSAMLIICEMYLDPEMKIEKLVEEIKEIELKEGWEMDIIDKIKIGEKEFIFEVIGRKRNQPTLRSKDKFLFLPIENNKRKVFWIEVVSMLEDWEDLKEEADKILDSAQLIE